MDVDRSMEAFNIEQDLAALLNELSVDELDDFVSANEDVNCDDDQGMEAYIYASILVSKRKASDERLNQAIRKSQSWIDKPTDHFDHQRRKRLREALSSTRHLIQSRMDKSNAPESLGAATSLSHDDPDPNVEGLRRKLVDALALEKEYKETSRVQALDDAIRQTEGLLDRLPGRLRIQALSHLATMFKLRFQRTKSTSDINRSVECLELAIPHIAPHGRAWSSFLFSLVMAAQERFKYTSTMANLDRLIEVTGMLVDSFPEGSMDQLNSLGNLGGFLFKRSQSTKSLDDLNRAIQTTSAAVDMCMDQDQSQVIMWLRNLRAMRYHKYLLTKSSEDLDETIDTIDAVCIFETEDSAEVVSHDNTDTAEILHDHARLLRGRHMANKTLKDLDSAVEYLAKASKRLPPNNLRFGLIDTEVVECLGLRYAHTKAPSDLDKTIAANLAALARASDPNGLHILNLRRHADLLQQRYHLAESLENLDEAIGAFQASLDSDDNRSEIIKTALNRLGSCPDQSQAMNQVDFMLQHGDKAFEAERVPQLHSLGMLLHARFLATNSPGDLDSAVHSLREALDAVTDDEQRIELRFLLGVLLSRRFEITRVEDDISSAIDHIEEVASFIPHDDARQFDVFSTFGDCLTQRYDSKGYIGDLYRAIGSTTVAVNLADPGSLEQAETLLALGSLLGLRFSHTRAMGDIDTAISTTRRAMQLQPGNKPLQAESARHSLGFLLAKLSRHCSADELDEAIRRSESKAVADLWPPDHPDQADRLNALGGFLRLRYEKKGKQSADDLNRAIECIRKAVEALPRDAHMKPNYTGHLGSALHLRYKLTHVDTDLEEAIEMLARSLDLIPRASPMRAPIANDLSACILSRGIKNYSTEDINAANRLCREEMAVATALPEYQIHLATRHAEIIANYFPGDTRWSDAYLVLQEAINVGFQMSTMSLGSEDIQHMMGQFTGLASHAAAAAMQAERSVYEAVTVLDLGRFVVASRLLETRGDISHLKLQHPELAARLDSLRGQYESGELENPLQYGGSRLSPQQIGFSYHLLATQLDSMTRRTISQKIQHLCEEIRTHVGFETFLLPPSEEEMMLAAKEGPIVIINLSVIRSDAFIIEHDRLRAVELPQLTRDKVEQQVKHLQLARTNGSFHAIAGVLEWLWDTACLPVLDALGFKPHRQDEGKGGGDWPHVWWIPTSLLTSLPFHAAGYHMRGSGDTVIDRVMSSYASSVKTLVEARRRRHRRHPFPGDDVAAVTDIPRGGREEVLSDIALLVAMQETPGLEQHTGGGHLRHAQDEVDILKGLCPSLQLRAVTPERPCKSAVLKHFETCQIFHFAGHGKSLSDQPSHSFLLLEDWQTEPLTVDDLRGLKPQARQPFLAYLSACSTSASGKSNFLDEAVHLVGAVQLSGFRHAVGTLWEVSDKHCVDVARILYETLRDEGQTDVAVCRGLHKALRALRDGQVQRDTWAREGTLDLGAAFKQTAQMAQTAHWVPYVHFGV